MSIFGLSPTETALVLTGILSTAILLSIFFWPDKPPKEKIRFGLRPLAYDYPDDAEIEKLRRNARTGEGYQPIGPGLDTSNPPKGGSGVKAPQRSEYPINDPRNPHFYPWSETYPIGMHPAANNPLTAWVRGLEKRITTLESEIDTLRGKKVDRRPEDLPAPPESASGKLGPC